MAGFYYFLASTIGGSHVMGYRVRLRMLRQAQHPQLPGMTALKDRTKHKMQKINRPLNLFWPVLFLIMPDICQRVKYK